MKGLKSNLIRARRTALALAIASALGVAVPAVNAKNSMAPASYAGLSELQGPLLVGPVQDVSKGLIKILGTVVAVEGASDTILPSQYVAVFGTMNRSGKISAHSVQVLDEVYAPGSSLILYSGKVSGSDPGLGVTRVGDISVNSILFSDWIAPRADTILVVVGTQAIDGAPVEASSLASFYGAGTLKIEQLGIQGIDGSGIFGIDGSGAFGIDGSGIEILGLINRGVYRSGPSLRGIDGSGASIQGIDGSGASLQGIDGSGASLQGIDGSGASLQGIDGSGASLQGIDGSGASLQGIDGSGASLQGIDGSGAM
jgi:hypothetical protein